MRDFLTSPWFIVGVVVAFLLSNFASVKYLSKKEFKSYKQKNNELDKLLKLDEKRRSDTEQKKNEMHSNEK